MQIVYLALLIVGICLLVLSIPNLDSTPIPGTPPTEAVVWTLVFIIALFDVIPTSVILVIRALTSRKTAQ